MDTSGKVDLGDGMASSRRTFLAASAAAAETAPLAASPAHADGRRHGLAPDRELREILREIDPRRIEATFRRLVAFGTRHTLSAQDDPVRGIGAARDCIYQELAGYGVQVELQSF